MKGQTKEIFGVVIMVFVGAVLVVAVLENYVSTSYFSRETSNWSLARDIAYKIVGCASSDIGIIKEEKISGVQSCLGFTDIPYKYSINNLDTGEQWQGSNLEATTNVKEHTLFVSIEKSEGSIDRGVVHVTLYTK